MTVRTRYWLAPALGVCLIPCPGRAEDSPAGPLSPTASPSVTLAAAAVSANQRTADAIAARLRDSGRLSHYTVDVSFRDGAAEVSGSVADDGQRDEVVRLVRSVPGVERVVDRLSVSGAIQRVQAADLPGALQPLPAGPRVPPPPPVTSAPPPAGRSGGGPGVGAAQGAGQGAGAPGAAAPPAAVAPAVPGPPEAMPIFQAPGPAPYALNPPKMPPYAWPTYAPYNNYSRVAYPLAYPYNSFPFIGPNYPFPKIPLGWRKVVLQWDDGYWWFSKACTKYDWWKLRYW